MPRSHMEAEAHMTAICTGISTGPNPQISPGKNFATFLNGKMFPTKFHLATLSPPPCSPGHETLVIDAHPQKQRGHHGGPQTLTPTPLSTFWALWGVGSWGGRGQGEGPRGESLHCARTARYF